MRMNQPVLENLGKEKELITVPLLQFAVLAYRVTARKRSMFYHLPLLFQSIQLVLFIT